MTSLQQGRPPLDRAALATAPIPVEVVEEAASTNALAAERARAGADPLVIVAEHQTAGRGRLDRSWLTPPYAALTFSVLLRPDVAPERWPWLPMLIGYAVRRSLLIEVDLKWPNDLMVDDRKVAGLLVERVDTPQGPAAIVGIGINVTTTREELPVENATSLALEGVDVDRSELLVTVVKAIHGAYARWLDDDTWLRQVYIDFCSTLGRRVRVDLPGGEQLTGTAVDIDRQGRLLVETSPGAAPTPVGAGDVVHVRATDV
jgi:BirA family biotin operon repressor/biotin-[acetyl-CoA-carboxylase] ligase